MSENGVAFLASRGRGATNVLATLDMLGRQAPAPDAAPTPLSMDRATQTAVGIAVAASTEHRIVISYGRGDDTYIIALERAPDWELVSTWNVFRQTAASIARVISAMLGSKGLKDYTGEFHALGPEAVSPDAPPAPAHPRAARGLPAGRATNAGRGRKNRPTDPAVELGGTADGPTSGRPGETLVPGPATGVPQTKQPGG